MIKRRASECNGRSAVGLVMLGLVSSLVVFSGCASQSQQQQDSLPFTSSRPPSSQEDGVLEGGYHPGLTLYSAEMLSMIAENNHLIGETGPAWVTRRNDRGIGLRPIYWDPFWYPRAIVTRDAQYRAIDGRARHRSVQRVRSVRSRRGR